MPLEASRGVAASNGYSTYVDIFTGENLACLNGPFFASSRRGGDIERCLMGGIVSQLRVFTLLEYDNLV